jgi:hypothetical protein
MVVAIVLLRWYSFFALMVADSVKHLIHTGVSAWLLGRGMQGYGRQKLITTTFRTILAAAGMGALTLITMVLLDRGLPVGGTLAHLVIVVGAGGIGLVSFAVLASLLRLDEWRWMRDLVRQRLQR